MQTQIIIAALIIGLVNGHGYLSDPPNRSSMWRYGYPTPIDYDDSQYFCGGFQTQWDVYGGKCGPCGDSYGLPRPRSNENTGKFGRGIVTKRYRAGQEITVKVQLIANHMGWFQFSVCKLATANQLEEDSCFSKNVLTIAGSSATQWKLPNSNTGSFTIRLRLPAGFTCSRCVLRWHYNSGNSWGVCPDGKGAMGCGKQENFRSCSDIAIDA